MRNVVTQSIFFTLYQFNTIQASPKYNSHKDCACISRTLCWYASSVILQVMSCPNFDMQHLYCHPDSHKLTYYHGLRPLLPSFSFTFLLSLHPSSIFISLNVPHLLSRSYPVTLSNFHPTGIWVLGQLSGLLYLGGSGCPCRGLTEALQTFIEEWVIRVLILKDCISNTNDPGAQTQRQSTWWVNTATFYNDN